MWNKIVTWFRQLFGGPKKTNDKETAEVLKLKRKYERWANNCKHKKKG